MASLTRIIKMLLMLLIVGLATCARSKSPLIIEDEGNRRNRPAGKFFSFISLKIREIKFLKRIMWFQRNQDDFFIEKKIFAVVNKSRIPHNASH